MKKQESRNASESSLIDNDQEEFFELLDEQNLEKIKKFLIQKKECQIWTYKNNDDENATVLHISVFKNNYEITKELIEYVKEHNNKGLKNFINEKNKQGMRPIHYASFKGNIKIIKLLMENDANPLAKSEKQLNIFHYACQRNKPNSLMFFYIYFKDKNNQEGLNLLTEFDKGHSTPLHWASYSNSEDVLLYLINLDIFENENKRREYIDQTDNQGNTALHLSVIAKSIRIVMKLLQNGASSDIKNEKKETPLELAHKKNLKEIEEIIKNNQSCQCCNIKAPVKQIKRSPKNIICVFLFQALTTFLLFFSIIPFAFNTMKDEKDEDNNCYNALFIVYAAFLIIFFILYITLLIKDPGIKKSESIEAIKKIFNSNDKDDKNNKKDLINYCYKCYIKKTMTSKHCIICNKCYEGFDHHCYWINKCVAKNNYYLFLIFLFETFIYLILIIAICIFGFIHFDRDVDKDIYFKFFKKVSFTKDNFVFNALPDKIKSKNYIYLILNIITTIIAIFFLIPEFILLCMHIKIYCSNLKENKLNCQKENGILLRDTTSSLLSNDSNSNSDNENDI